MSHSIPNQFTRIVCLNEKENLVRFINRLPWLIAMLLINPKHIRKNVSMHGNICIFYLTTVALHFTQCPFSYIYYLSLFTAAAARLSLIRKGIYRCSLTRMCKRSVYVAMRFIFQFPSRCLSVYSKLMVYHYTS